VSEATPALVDAVRYVGVVMAVAGAVFTGHEAIGEWWKRRGVLRRVLGLPWRVARRIWGRFLLNSGRLPPPVNLVGGAVSTAHSTSTSYGYPLPAPLTGEDLSQLPEPERLARIEQRLQITEAAVTGISGSVGHQNTQLSDLGQRFSAVEGRVVALDDKLDEYMRTLRRFDLRALPAVVVGILLSALPDQLVRRTWIDVALLVVAGLTILWVAWSFVREPCRRRLRAWIDSKFPVPPPKP
jgi:hypothetical protein